MLLTLVRVIEALKLSLTIVSISSVAVMGADRT